MQIRYNVTGTRRKELVRVISDATGIKPRYMGMPDCSYEIGCFKVTRDGTLEFDGIDVRRVERVLEAIAAAGFLREAQDAVQGLTVEVPADSVSVDKLKKILDSKGDLIKKALGTENTGIEVTDETVRFPWFNKLPDPDSAKAYTHFIDSLCKMSKEQSRVNATEKEVVNEKYAFRCFLLRLGYIGTEYKAERKILLRNLSGCSSRKNGYPERGN